ncbi:hypothetical protein FEM03_17785 [Phragmitibacter flavus]|uniref:Uncharacterized protein n=1 Tax=Phragmitibacter flavus TaxID=2576071 RepID=A0A5R8KD19_9BACT|nr:hypothetical protein [Phragmitibacter flavus]TLD69489.1 hypothetical protein FEM03_17785 [Phragmitibacter flavus]
MKSSLQYTFLLSFLLLGAVRGSPVDTAHDWEKNPLLNSISISAQGIMGEYEAWSNDWSKSDRKPTEKDQIINRITESFFISFINCLAVARNPQLLTQGARFLDTQVPSEFDHLWKFVFIEFVNAARDADGKLLQSEHLINLKKRATN